ncbi:MAG: TolC family protein [Pseudomonadota bacterium]
MSLVKKMHAHRRSRCFVFYIVSAILPLLAGIAFATDMPLTEDEAIALFYQRNLDLIAARYNVEAARAQQIIAAAIPNPVLSLNTVAPGLVKGHGSGFLGANYDNVARLEQLIETAGKRGLRRESSRFGVQAAEDDLRDAVRLLSNQVRRAYYNLLLAQQLVELTLDTVSRYNEIVRTNGLRLESGDISESDFMRVEVERFKAQNDLDQALLNLSAARTGLAVLLALPAETMNFVAQDVTLSRGEFDVKQAPESFIAQAMAQRPDLHAARVRIDQSEKDLALARANRMPDVTVALQDEVCPSPVCWPGTDNAIGLGVSLPLPVFYRNQGQIAQAQISFENAKLQVRQLEQGIGAEVLEAAAAWRTADGQARRFEGDILSRVKVVRQAAELAYSKGATSILDFIEAQRSYRNSVLEYRNALYNRAVAYADLVKVLGIEQTPPR